MDKKKRDFTSYSGTKQYEEKTKGIWEGLFNKYEVMNEELYGDVKKNGEIVSPVETLDQFFLSLKEAPIYRYVIIRLCNDLAISSDVSQYIKMFIEIENDGELSEESEQILSKLTQVLAEKYEENTKKEAPAREIMKEKLLHFDKEFLLSFLIWAVEYNTELIEGFLKAVLGGQGFDYYDPEQFLTYLAFAYHYQGTRSRYEIFERMKEIYDSLEPDSFKDQEVKGTQSIRVQADDQLNNAELCLDEEVSSELVKVLKWHKTLKAPIVRTVGREYTKLLDEVQTLYYQEIQNFLHNYENMQDEQHEKNLHEYLNTIQNICLTVTYDGSIDPDVDPDDKKRGDGSSAAIFRRGTAIYGENFVYTIEKDVTFPRRKTIPEVLIPVAAISSQSAPGTQDTIPSDARLYLCDKNGVINKEMIDKFHVKAYTFPSKLDKKPVWRSLAKPAYTFDKDGGKGYLLVDAAPGFEVYGGKTYFCYEEDGVRYLYMVRKDVKFLCKKDIAPYYTRKEVLEVYRKESLEEDMDMKEIKRLKKTDGGLRLENSRITYRVIEPDLESGRVQGIENIIYIGNNKPVIYRTDIFTEKLSEDELKRAMARSQAPLLLNIEYPATQEVHLKKGMRFVAKSYLKKDIRCSLKGREQNTFVLLHDMVLPASNQRTVALQVVSMDEESRPGVREKFLNEKAEIHVERDGESIGTIFEVKCGELPKPRLYREGKAGYLYVTCECGTVIDKETRFVAEMKGQKYTFVPVMETTKVNPDFVEFKNIPVFVDEQNMYMLSTSESGKHEGEYVLTRANTYFDVEEPLEGVKFRTILAENRYLWDPKAKEKAVSRAEFFEYLYSLTDYHYFENYLPALNLENLSVEWFRKMFPQNWTEEEFCSLPVDQIRSVLMTLAFMKEAKEKELKMWEAAERGEEKAMELQEEVYNEFELAMDAVMERCRMDEFYMGKPCDCLLAYLYICDSPADALRTLFKLSKGRRR